jgi:hypothetical protein
MTQRSSGNSGFARSAQQQAFPRCPGAKFEGETLGLVQRLDRLEAPAQIRSNEAAMGCRVIAHQSCGLGQRVDRMAVTQVHGWAYCE